MSTEKTQNPHSVAQAKYDKDHTVGVYMKLNVESDWDILDWLHLQKSKQGAIKKLIREEIERQSKKILRK